ncbi:hypothetical protein Ciccas_013757, partial [Cichlidogyrus casuarinus]
YVANNRDLFLASNHTPSCYPDLITVTIRNATEVCTILNPLKIARITELACSYRWSSG